jgi:hypothetical protein
MHKPMKDYFFPFNPGLKLKSGFFGKYLWNEKPLDETGPKDSECRVFLKKRIITMYRSFLRMVNPV